MITEKAEFLNNLGQRISGRIYREDPVSRKGIIFCHGLFSTKDGYKITALAENIVKAGYSLMTFDFSFVGESDGKLEDLSVIQEVKDLAAAADFFRDYGMEELHIMGSSMGGVVALLYLEKHPDAFCSAFLIATPVNLTGLIAGYIDPSSVDSLPADGFTVLEGIRLNNGFFREIVQIDVMRAAASIRLPVFILHGEEDQVVSCGDARLLHDGLNGEKQLLTIKGGDHNLTSPEHLDMIWQTLDVWLQKQMGQKR